MGEAAEVIKMERSALAEFEISPAKVAEMAKEYMTLTVPEGDNKAYKVVRAALTTVVKTRTGTDKRRKDLGADARAWIGEVNQAQKDLIAPLAPVEEHLKAELKREDERKAAIKAEEARIEAERVEKLRDKVSSIQRLVMGLNGLSFDQLVDIANEIDNLEITPEEYFEFTAEAKQAKEDAVTAIKQAIEERVQLDREEAERKAEAERLKKEREAQEAEAKRLAEEKAKIEAERIAEEERQAQVQAKIIAAQKEEQDRLDAERKALDAEKEAIRKAEADRIAAEESKAKSEQEAKELAEREEKERLAREKAEAEEKERQEALRPDKEKILGYALTLLELAEPQVETNEAKELMLWVHGQLESLANTVQSKCGAL